MVQTVEWTVVVVVVVDSVFVDAVQVVERGAAAAAAAVASDAMTEGRGRFVFIEVALFKRDEGTEDAAWAFTFD